MTRYRWALAAIFALIWVVAAVDPLHRDGWFLENILVFIFVPAVLIAGRYFQLSNLSYTLITLFLILHVIGSHWTYAEVPFGDILGEWFLSERNMYDRLVHFGFGLLLAYPIREVFILVTGSKGVWGYYFPFDVVLSFSAFYEILEWLAAITVGGPIAIGFIGAQGDPWDTQKDMACAALGAAIAVIIVLFINLWYNGGLKAEMRESLRIKNKTSM